MGDRAVVGLGSSTADTGANAASEEALTPEDVIEEALWKGTGSEDFGAPKDTDYELLFIGELLTFLEDALTIRGWDGEVVIGTGESSEEAVGT